MSKKVDLDFYLRQALARWQAKHDWLIEKWHKRLSSLRGSEFFHCSEIVNEFLDDLETPIDSIVSNFDLRDCK